MARLRDEFANSFRLFLHIKDPLLPGIVVGKSAAMAYGGPVLKAACDELGLDPSRTMVTDLDSDFRLHPQYFAYITLQFCAAEDRLVSIWQPVPVFLNNIWRVPTAVRVMATAATQWQMFLHQNPHRLVMFSSYSMSLDLLAERRLLGLRRDPRGLAVLLEGLLPHAAASSTRGPRSSLCTAMLRALAATPQPTRRSTTRSNGGHGEQPISLT